MSLTDDIDAKLLEISQIKGEVPGKPCNLVAVNEALDTAQEELVVLKEQLAVSLLNLSGVEFTLQFTRNNTPMLVGAHAPTVTSIRETGKRQLFITVGDVRVTVHGSNLTLTIPEEDNAATAATKLAAFITSQGAVVNADQATIIKNESVTQANNLSTVANDQNSIITILTT